MAGIIDIKITENQLKEDMDEYYFNQLKESGRVEAFMQDIRNAMLVDYEDEIDYFIAEYGLE